MNLETTLSIFNVAMFPLIRSTDRWQNLFLNGIGNNFNYFWNHTHFSLLWLFCLFPLISSQSLSLVKFFLKSQKSLCQVWPGRVQQVQCYSQVFRTILALMVVLDQHCWWWWCYELIMSWIIQLLQHRFNVNDQVVATKLKAEEATNLERLLDG